MPGTILPSLFVVCKVLTTYFRHLGILPLLDEYSTPINMLLLLKYKSASSGADNKELCRHSTVNDTVWLDANICAVLSGSQSVVCILYIKCPGNMRCNCVIVIPGMTLSRQSAMGLEDPECAAIIAAAIQIAVITMHAVALDTIRFTFIDLLPQSAIGW